MYFVGLFLVFHTAAPHKKTSVMSKNGVFNIAMGTYEQLLYGIDVDADTLLAAKDEQDATQATSVLRTTFAMPCHIGSIRTCASSSKYLATGSTDETLKCVARACARARVCDRAVVEWAACGEGPRRACFVGQWRDDVDVAFFFLCFIVFVVVVVVISCARRVSCRVFDLVKRKEIGSIHHHSGETTASLNVFFFCVSSL